MQLCDLMENNVNSCSDKAHKGYRPVGYWAKHSDIDWSTVIYDENLVEFQLKESALFKEIYDNSVMPFDGSYPYFTQTSTHGYTLSNDRVKFPLKRFDPANAELIGALAKGTRIVIILEQYINGSARFCVFGLSGGLRLSEETALDMSGDDKTIEVDLVDVNTNYPNLFLWAGSEAATLLLLESMIGVRVQSIDNPVFELGLTYVAEETSDWGDTIEFIPANATDKRLIFESSDPTVAIVGTGGVIGIISDYADDGFKFCTIKATSVDGGKTTECLVVNNADFGIFKFNFGGGDFTAEFDESCYLVKPNGDIAALTTGVAVADVPAGVCHLIYEKANTYIDVSGMPIIGELKTLFGGTLYCNNCTSLTALSAPMATELNCSGCTSLTALSAPMANILYCTYCTSLTTLSAPMATNLYCYNCTSLTTLSAPMANILYCYNCTSLTALSAPMATDLNCSECALTATSIASILADAVLLPDLLNIIFYLSGGTNAPIGTWSAQAVADKDTIVGAGGMVFFNS